MFKKLLKEKILILDGAMGSNLQKYGLNEDDAEDSLKPEGNVEAVA